ncbi:TrkH family potassium uptake protein [Roseospirillum parvum]|uniref:Trk system potassium uptake protein n=1 Tax=Roseospirillum parvum TaxID=83401 RepID=A0A1G7TS52_9PROT|nr:TrkH family potassium uptake protein [Roseospirillum parvum]SDG37479.1 trk system potassium uptake protein TrkH [Roseospirillum parvum]
MINLRPVFQILGVLLSILSAGMLIPALVDLAAGNPDWISFTGGGALGLFVGIALMLSCWSGPSRITIRQAFLLTNLTWLVLPAFAAVPFMFSILEMSFTDAFFEAMSGITTTGSTVISGLDNAPPGLLLWRAILQWLGGIGIIIMALTVLPMLRVGGMQIFKVEAFEAQEKVMPRATQLASGLTMVYVLLTAIWTVMYTLAGMSLLDGVAHAMTTIATGGYSTHDLSLAYFDSARIDAIATVGMVVGSIPFILYLQAVRGNPGRLFTDTQVRWFLAIVVASVAAVVLYLWQRLDMPLPEALRHGSFNLISVMTGTGYATTDFWQWGGLPVMLMFGLMFVGGCAGSTTCGIKIFRFQVLYAVAKTQVQRLLQPSGVFIPYFNRKPLLAGVGEAVMGFFFLYGVSVGVLTIVLGAFGLDYVTALSGAATAISNVGPGLGETIGPAGNFASLPDGAKWALSFGMMLGRLELFTVLVLLMPRFWRG